MKKFAALTFIGMILLAPLIANERLNTIPLRGANFEGENLPLSDSEKKHYDAAELLKRWYTVNGQDFFVTIIDGSQNTHAVRDPYWCFTDAGWTILKETSLPIKNGDAALLEISKDGQKREAILWYSNGRIRHAAPWRSRLQSFLGTISFGLLDTEPVLVVVQPIDDKPVDWKKFEKSFPQLFDI